MVAPMQRTSLCVLVLITACSTTTVRSPGPTQPATVVDSRAELAANRAALLDRLHDYWLAGEFPLDEQQRPASVFRDGAGRECPMASMISQSGHSELVAEVVRTNNHLRLADVEAGPLMAWMLTSGLTRDEIILVQGAADLDYGQFQIQFSSESSLIAAAHDEVKNRVRIAEAQLRAQTANSLEVAFAALPQALEVAARTGAKRQPRR
jgi:hypothetical protein